MSTSSRVPKYDLSILKKIVKDYMRIDYKESITALSMPSDTHEDMRVESSKEPPALDDTNINTKEACCGDKENEESNAFTVTPDTNILEALIIMFRRDLQILYVEGERQETVGALLREDLKEVESALWANMCTSLTSSLGDGKESSPQPEGPFRAVEGCTCAILLFVPADPIGEGIDAATGNYGYSHAAVDCCEIDEQTGRHVMIEATANGVHRSFTDVYGDRDFERISLAAHSIDCEAFCECVKLKIGQPFDTEEAVSKGGVDDDERQICSGLVKTCLPDNILHEIVRRARAGDLQGGSVIPREDDDVFVSPNGLAEFFGVPKKEGQLERLLKALNDFLCKKQKLCYEFNIRAENLRISNITQTPIPPSPSIGCTSLTDGMIEDKVRSNMEMKVNREFIQRCPAGCRCVATGELGPLIIHIDEHIVQDINQVIDPPLPSLLDPLKIIDPPDIHCRVTLDVNFDIVIRGRIGICLKS